MIFDFLSQASAQYCTSCAAQYGYSYPAERKQSKPLQNILLFPLKPLQNLLLSEAFIKHTLPQVFSRRPIKIKALLS